MDRETLRLEIFRTAYRPTVKTAEVIAQCREFEAYITEPEKKKPGRPPKVDQADTE